MKNFKKLAIGVCALGTVFTGCKDKHIESRTFMANVPVYRSYEDVRKDIKMEDAKDVINPGKIYVYNNYVLINEQHKGIHIVNNSNPSNPQNVAFISLPGNMDVEVKGNHMYADSYTDLVVLDISDLFNPSEVNRIEDVFQYRVPEYDLKYPLAKIDQSQGVIVDWEIQEVTESCSGQNCGTYYFTEQDFLVEGSSGGFNATSNVRNFSPGNSGKGGSTAKFSINGNCLYAITSTSDISTFNISNTGSPMPSGTTDAGWNLETLFSFNDNLFIGSENGMYIYDVSNCSPTYVSTFDHAEACDPVVVDGDYAYVTLRTGNRCTGWQNELDVVSIENLKNPYLVNEFDMTNPHGLGVDSEQKLLFLCDGNDGLKIFDTTSPGTCGYNSIKHYANIHAYDVIPLDGLLMMIGDDGLYQYDYTDVNNIQLLSVIPVAG
ncbi:MAG: hypothetical protein MRY83_14730 [Flavobacteriales bacterium]|nr:hypothetical protein [Flavobacteriales bacterium]